MPSSPESPLRALFKALEKKCPKYHQEFEQVCKVVGQTAVALDRASPYFAKAADYASVVKEQTTRFKLEEFGPMLLGLALCFFGGAYTMLIAVVETVHLLCWEDLKHSFEVLYHNYELAAEQNRKDNCVDVEGNGVEDVLEMCHTELLSCKAVLFLKSVDVEAAQMAGRTFGAAAMAVIAALRVKFARSLALGGSLANMAMDYIPLEEALRDALPAEHKKWAGVIAKVVINAIAMMLASLVSGAIGMLHSCIRGAHMFVQHTVHLAKDHGLLEDDMTLDNPKAKALVAVVASIGLLWQATHTEANPFPINVFLLPFTVAEYALFFLVNGFLFAAP
ncbi:hypothetical protein LPMP_211140 [Leishmania panamensis]|uniref:Uncharacterized protein n=3 Tax=Leishmania guyanensis species complex TaxID=38579 RepID=A0A088RQG9_LEIPA|nr:hypothetical protein LPMP_211140 [Leishmania panamensis]AIN98193.1 hypothetical protein LPMP_211140 [Leishmania panamensis]CCM15451.1 hypothetical protein, conserved [Leishmania guyanensis]